MGVDHLLCFAIFIVSGYKKEYKIQSINFSDPQSRNCGQFHLVLLFDDHVILPKAEKRKIPILVTTRSQNLIKRDFLIHYLKLYVVSCYFCLKIFLANQ